MKYNYNLVMRCVGELGIDKVFTASALDILLEYSGAEDDVIFPLISLLDKPFTDEAVSFMEQHLGEE